MVDIKSDKDYHLLINGVWCNIKTFNEFNEIKKTLKLKYKYDLSTYYKSGPLFFYTRLHPICNEPILYSIGLDSYIRHFGDLLEVLNNSISIAKAMEK